jgi:phosphoglycolate phosphatase-like HAD superfamily hydrolase
MIGVAPERCALIGDANSDLRMARSAGVAVALGYSTGWRQPEPRPLLSSAEPLGGADGGAMTPQARRVHGP